MPFSIDLEQPPARTPVPRFWVPLFIAAGPILLFGPALLTGRVIYWGTPSLQFIPWWTEAFRLISTGQLPLWNSWAGMGAPLLANYQSALFYPPNWILCGLQWLAGAPGTAWGYTLLACFHLIWAGLGMAALVRRLGAGQAAQAAAGMAFSLSGYLIARVEFFSMIWTAAWLPWVIWATEGLIDASAHRSPRAAPTAWLTAILAMQLLAGHAQLTWYTLILAGGWLLYRTLSRYGWGVTWSAAWRFAACGLFAAGLAAVQLLPTAEYLLQSQRAGEYGYADAMTYSFWPWRLVTLFAPDFFGNPGRGDFWGYASYWEDAAYIGMLPILLAIGTLARLTRKPRPGSGAQEERGFILFLWGWVILSILLAFGKNTPIFPFLYRYIPTFNMFQAPARFLIWAVFALCLLAAVGMDGWRMPTGKGLNWLKRGNAAALAVTIGAGAASFLLREVKVTFIQATALAGGWALGSTFLALWIRRARTEPTRRVWVAAVLVWILADLLAAGWLLNPSAPAGLFSPSSSQLIALRDTLAGKRVYIQKQTEYSIKFERFLRFKDLRPSEEIQNLRRVVLPDLNILDQIATANHFDPMTPGRYAVWMETLARLSGDRRLEWLRWMNVGAVEYVDATQPGGVRFDPVEGGQAVRFFGCASPVSDGQDSLKRMETGQAGTLWLEGVQPVGDQDCQAAGSAEVETWDGGKVMVRVQTGQGGWLFLSQTWMPGWRVEVNGIEGQVIRANYLFQAVAVPPGESRVVLQYNPTSFLVGGLLSILVSLVILVILFRSRQTPGRAVQRAE